MGFGLVGGIGGKGGDLESFGKLYYNLALGFDICVCSVCVF